MKNCRNCDELVAREHASMDYALFAKVAVNCGNHDMYDPAVERMKQEWLQKAAANITRRLQSAGFWSVTASDVTVGVVPGSFSFAYDHPLKFSQLDRLAHEFRTKVINWSRGNAYTDSDGTHETGVVELEGAEEMEMVTAALFPEDLVANA